LGREREREREREEKKKHNIVKQKMWSVIWLFGVWRGWGLGGGIFTACNGDEHRRGGGGEGRPRHGLGGERK
jgi:hypothetical protein